MDGGAGGGAKKGEPSVDLPAAGALGPDAILNTEIEDLSPSPLLSPPPVDLTLEAGTESWQSLEAWGNYLTLEEKKLAHEKSQFEEKCRADWAKLDEDWAELQEKKRRFEQECREDWSRLEEHAAQQAVEQQCKLEMLEQEKRQFEQQCQEDRAKWVEEKVEQLRKVEELDRIKNNLHLREDALKRLLAEQRVQLQKPLLVQVEHNYNNNNGTWNMVPIVSVLAFASGLILFSQIQTLFPVVYLKYIVDAFAILWAFGSVVWSFRTFEKFRGKNSFSHHVARVVYLCFTVFGLYSLYLMSRHIDGTSFGASPPSSSTSA